jgi:polar amino acid transport system substrate-binding protein
MIPGPFLPGRPVRMVFALWAIVAFAVSAQADGMVVAVHDKPPFAFRDESGSWTGIGIQLWEAAAKDNNWQFRYEEVPSEDLLPSLAGRKVDVVVGELLVNAPDERVIDFSQPFLESSIGVAVSSRDWHPSWLHILLHAFDWTLLRVFFLFIPVLLIVSFLIWILERHRADGHFGGKSSQGIGSAFWFSTVTMTSTGYGDKVPVTFLGRTLSVAWMFMSLLLITAFTASVASTVATVRSSTLVRSTADLRHYRNGIQLGGVAAQVLDRYSAPMIGFQTYEEALQRLADGGIDTVVGESTSLQYLINKDYEGRLVLLPLQVFSSRIAFGFPQKSVLLEPFNISLLNFIHSPAWASILKEYLGSEALAPMDATHPPTPSKP